MIVLDASIAVSGLLNAGPAREILTSEQLHAPHLIDSEVVSALRRHVRSGRMGTVEARKALDRWRRLGLVRYGVVGLLDRIWELRDNMSAYDAGYVGLAETLGCSLFTGDARLSRAPGVRCTLTIVPN